MGTRRRHELGNQPDSELRRQGRQDRMHDAGRDRSPALGDRGRRAVGPVLGWLRLEQRMRGHVDRTHVGLPGPTALRVPRHAGAGEGHRRVQPRRRPRLDLLRHRRRQRTRREGLQLERSSRGDVAAAGRHRGPRGRHGRDDQPHRDRSSRPGFPHPRGLCTSEGQPFDIRPHVHRRRLGGGDGGRPDRPGRSLLHLPIDRRAQHRRRARIRRW